MVGGRRLAGVVDLRKIEVLPLQCDCTDLPRLRTENRSKTAGFARSGNHNRVNCDTLRRAWARAYTDMNNHVMLNVAMKRGFSSNLCSLSETFRCWRERREPSVDDSHSDKPLPKWGT